MARRRNRIWSEEEKRSICHQTRAAGVSVAQVGRRYALNANLIHKWLRDPRFAPETGDEAEEMPDVPVDDTSTTASPVFLPVELVAEAAGVGDGRRPASQDALAPLPGGVIQIELAGGHRLRIEGAYDPDALARLLRGLAESPP